MVHNSANINKMSNHLSIQIDKHYKKNPQQMMMAWDRHKTVTGLNQISIVTIIREGVKNL